MKNFILHLRLNYQILILSGPYLLGILLSDYLSILQLVQFFSIHILLFGGVTVYNSHFDKDEGPIGGLKNPPKMDSWMLILSWVFQVLGLIIATYSGIYFILVYLLSALFFWMYSSPHIRLKGKPIGSLFAIGVSTVVCPTFLGYYANGSIQLPSVIILIATFGSLCLVLSLYPLSQSYQIDEDLKRKDITFSVRYGKNGIKNLFLFLFPIGLLFVAYALGSINLLYAILFIFFGIISEIIILSVIKKITMTRLDYEMIMRIKYMSGLLFSLSILIFIILK